MESSRFVYLKSNFDPGMALALGKSVYSIETKTEHDSFFSRKVTSYLSKRFFKLSREQFLPRNNCYDPKSTRNVQAPHHSLKLFKISHTLIININIARLLSRHEQGHLRAPQ